MAMLSIYSPEYFPKKKYMLSIDKADKRAQLFLENRHNHPFPTIQLTDSSTRTKLNIHCLSFLFYEDKYNPPGVGCQVEIFPFFQPQVLHASSFSHVQQWKADGKHPFSGL